MRKIFTSKQSIGISAALIVLAVSAFFMVNVELPPWSHWVSGINVIVFAVPAFLAATRWAGNRAAVILFVLLGSLALLIESSAIITGFPYGHFGYSGLLGFKLFGSVPWTVALAWTPLVLAAFAIARVLSDRAALRIFIAAFILLLFDLALDPGAVKLGFWQYADGGSFYGVPVSNFLGWIVSGTVAAIVLEAFAHILKPLLPVPVQLISSSFFIIFFWTCIAVFGEMLLPAAIGFAVLIVFAAIYRKHHYAFDEMIVMVNEENDPIATERRSAAHNHETKLHRAFSVFLFNSRGELLLQRRALTKKTWPGVWSNSCCGHPMLFESVEDAAIRRLRYELGIKIASLQIVLPDFRYRAEKDGIVENELCPVLVGFTEEQPVLNSAEVAEILWVKWGDALKLISDPANGYSPWAVQEALLLNRSEAFNDLIFKMAASR